MLSLKHFVKKMGFHTIFQHLEHHNKMVLQKGKIDPRKNWQEPC